MKYYKIIKFLSYRLVTMVNDEIVNDIVYGDNEETLRKMLSDLKDEHVGKLSFLSTYSSNNSIDIIFKYDSKIEEVSNELGISNKVIYGACIFRRRTGNLTQYLKNQNHYYKR